MQEEEDVCGQQITTKYVTPFLFFTAVNITLTMKSYFHCFVQSVGNDMVGTRKDGINEVFVVHHSNCCSFTTANPNSHLVFVV